MADKTYNFVDLIDSLMVDGRIMALIKKLNPTVATDTKTYNSLKTSYGKVVKNKFLNVFLRDFAGKKLMDNELYSSIIVAHNDKEFKEVLDAMVISYTEYYKQVFIISKTDVGKIVPDPFVTLFVLYYFWMTQALLIGKFLAMKLVLGVEEDTVEVDRVTLTKFADAITMMVKRHHGKIQDAMFPNKGEDSYGVLNDFMKYFAITII
jgi:hypothetical protein